MNELEFTRARDGRLLVPADLAATLPAACTPPTVDGPGTELALVEPVTVTARPVPDPSAPDASAQQLRGQLAAERELTQVTREHELSCRAEAVEHALAMAEVADQVAAAKRAREDHKRDTAELDALTALYRKAARSGTRARVAAEIGRTAEMRALRVAKVQKVSLWVGLGLLVGFGAWSTAGVHDGLVRLLDLAPGSAGWRAGWIVEPLLITIVAGLILIRALLRSSGGDVDRRARLAEGVALAVSVALNMLGGWHDGGGRAEALGQALAHSVGAFGAAGTAWLIGVVIDYTTAAEPWKNAPRVADLDLGGPNGGLPDGINRGKLAAGSTAADGLPDDVRTLLADVRDAITEGTLQPNPSSYAIHKHVMGGRGDKARATKVAGLVTGWRPGLRAVSGGAADVAS